MPHDDPAERLDALLSGATTTADDAELVELVELAGVVARRPAERFRTRLRLDLERTFMTTTTTATEQVDATVARPAGISYLHIPTDDPRRSGEFYAAVFGWELRGDPDAPSFTDGTGHVIGAWHTDLPVVRDGGVLPYVFVERVDDALARVVANGGEIVRAPYPEGPLTVATFRDPAGNVVGVWQAPAEA